MEYIIFLIVVFIVILFVMGSHAPLFKINGLVKENIRKNGLIHFTSMECLDSIMENGLIGSDADMGFPETLLGKMVWTYQYENEEVTEAKHEIVVNKKRGKENPKRYGICIKITGISEEELNRLYTRHGFINDGAIVYRGTVLKAKKMELIKEWE